MKISCMHCKSYPSLSCGECPIWLADSDLSRDDLEKEIRKDERNKILDIIIEGEPTNIGRRITIERIYDYIKS